MENRNLPNALCDSITDEAGSAAANILEAGLDSIIDDSVLKDVPLLSTVASIYKISHSIKERHYMKKLAEFIQALNKGLVGDSQVKVFRDRILYDQKKSKKELEYILILVDRYISDGKSTIIAKLYLSYLDSEISWEEFSVYSEVTDQLFMNDLDFLRKEGNQIISEASNDVVLRLMSMGLLFEVSAFGVSQDGNLYYEYHEAETKGNKKTFSRTMFGTKYIKIIDSTNF